MSDPTRIDTTVAIAGGGPAGVMLGVLLARAGIDTIVLEKYPDFFRDFRGDTIHPSTLDLMAELGWLDDFLKLPHDELRAATACIDGQTIALADFTHLPTRCKFIAFTPQWDLLNFLAARGRNYPTFHLMMETSATGLIEENGAVVGMRASGKDGPIEIRAALVVGADGRHSTIRDCSGFTVHGSGAPMDVLWMRIPKAPGDPERALGNLGRHGMLVMIDRHEYWQCAYVIAKGSYAALKAEGIGALQAAMVAIVPEIADRVTAIDDWSKVSFLEVRVDHVDRWHKPGLLCIGDAAHAMSPVGGVGINLAVQDAVATANAVAEPLRRSHAVDDRILAAIASRRVFPMRVTQRVQVAIQNTFIAHVVAGDGPTRVPIFLRVAQHVPFVRRFIARMMGVGVRPEHVRTPDAFAARAPAAT